jgi:hypothetical protein
MTAVLPDQNPSPGKLTPAQIAQWAAGAGFGGVLTAAAGITTAKGENPLQVAVAIALAESGGDPDAVHHNADGSVDRGVWQINDRAHPDLYEKWPQWWSATNADMAFGVYQSAPHGGNSFSPWSTYKSGAYLIHMPAAKTAITDVSDPTVQGTVVTNNPLVNATNGLLSIAQGIFKAGAWMASPANWGRVALVTLGGAALVGALFIVAKPAIEGAVDQVGKVVP